MAGFRYPFDIQTTLEPWRHELGHSFDAAVATLADRDRALEDFLGKVTRNPGDGSYFINPRLGVGETSFLPGGSEAIETGGLGSGISMVDRDNAAARWVIYPNAAKLRLYDGTADRVTIDRTTGWATVGSARIQSWPGVAASDTTFAAFMHTSQIGAGTYALLQGSDGTTYLNGNPSGTGVRLRINNVDSAWLNTDKSLHAVALGNSGTVPEAVSGGTLVSGTGQPNYIIQAGTAVPNFVGGNANFSWPIAMANVYAVVVSEGGGAGDTVVGTQTYSTTGTGVYAVRAGAVVNGLVRVNYFVLGS